MNHHLFFSDKYVQRNPPKFLDDHSHLKSMGGQQQFPSNMGDLDHFLNIVALDKYCFFVLSFVRRLLIFVLRSMCLKIGLISTAPFDGGDTGATFLLPAGLRAVGTLTIVEELLLLVLKMLRLCKYALIAVNLGDEAKCFVNLCKSAAD